VLIDDVQGVHHRADSAEHEAVIPPIAADCDDIDPVHATGTRLAVAMAYARLRRYPARPFHKLRYVRNKQEVHL
jgi:hypothetical protein